MLWIGIWMHPYTVTMVNFGEDFGNLGQHGYYEMMACWRCWGYRPSLTASYIHIGYMKRVWAPSYAVDRHMGAPSHYYTGKVGPDFGNLGQCGYYEMMACWCCWGCSPPLFASHIHIRYTKSVWAPSYAVDRHMGAPLHCYTGKDGPDFGNLGQRGYYEMMHDNIVEAVEHHWLFSAPILAI